VWNHFLFAQDDWRVTRSLTLNLGVRLEVAGGVTEVNNLISNLDVDCRQPLGAAGTGPLGCFSIGRPSFHTNYNWGPRFGFAWNPGGSDRTVVRGGYGIAHDFIFLSPINSQRFLPPFSATLAVSGQANFPADGPNSLARIVAGNSEMQQQARASVGVLNPALVNVGTLNPAIDEGLSNPYAPHWNFGVQRKLGMSLVAKVTYVGTAGRHLLRSRPLNPIAAPPEPAVSVSDETARAAQFVNSFSAATGTASRGSNRIDPRFNEVTWIESSASSIYHSMQAEVERRFAEGFYLKTGYTFGKSIDDVSDVLNVFANDSALQQNPFDNRDNRAVSQFDIAHRFFFVHQWELPWGKSIANRILRHLASGWGMLGVTSFRSGFPLTLEAGARRGMSALTLTGILSGPVRPNTSGPFVFDPKPAGDPEVVQGVVNVDGVQPIATYANSIGLSQPLLGNYGTLSRNSNRMNGEVNFDWNIYKNFRFTEFMKLQLRCEVYNAFNNTSFYNLNRNITNAAFAQYTATGQQTRFLQLAARFVF
jgi:hypothetical protein